MKHAPLRGLRCFPRESTGSRSGKCGWAFDMANLPGLSDIIRPVCVDTALAPACVDRAGGSSPHPAKPLVLTRWSTWVVRETAGQSASGPMSRTSPKLASTRTFVPSMRTVVPWSPPNSICHTTVLTAIYVNLQRRQVAFAARMLDGGVDGVFKGDLG